MPRPDSKIIGAAVTGDTPTPDAAAPAAAPAPAVKTPRVSKVKPAVVVLSKGEKKAKIAELQAAAKQAREPLTSVENDIRAKIKAKADAAKLLATAQKDHDKAAKALDKEIAALQKTQTKYTAVFDKTKAKFDAEIVALKS